MNILILSSNNPYITSGVVSYNLFLGLQSKGHNTKMIVKEYANYKEKNIVSIQSWVDFMSLKITKKLKRILGIKKNTHDFLIDDYAIHDYDETKQYFKTKAVLKHVDFKPDVILYLFPQHYLNVENLYEIQKATNAPIYWYLMDSAALTGGCHYFWDCRKYLTGCGSCPGMNSLDPNDQSAINFKFKQKFISKMDVRIITGTTNDYNKAKGSLLFKDKPIHKTFLPADEIFKPVPKDSLRKKFDLPDDKIIFFIGTNILPEKRKGMDYLIEALEIIKEKNKGENIFLLIAGKRFEYIEKRLPFDYKYMGYFNNKYQLAEAYQLADFYICPSIEDGGPFMINQSITCGTPLVSFEVGVAPDLVIPNETGFIAELKNVNELAAKIIQASLLSKKRIQELSNNSRKLALEKLSLGNFLEEMEKILSINGSN